MTIQDLEHEIVLHDLFVVQAMKQIVILPGHKEQHLDALEYGRKQGWLWDEFFSEENRVRWGWRYRLTETGIERLFHRTS